MLKLNQTLKDVQWLWMTNQARQQLQQKTSLGFMKEKTIVKIADTLGSPEALKS